MEVETHMVPSVFALLVCDEAHDWLKAELPREWIRKLVVRANATYARSLHFRQVMLGPDNPGRDALWSFMRQWLCALLRKHRPRLHARLPLGYNLGFPPPPPPPMPEG